MDAVVLAGRLILAAVFAVAGGTKLADLGRARASLVQFGVPLRLAAPGSVLLPLVELGVAAGLVLNRSAIGAGAGALVLLSLFIGAVGRMMARGQRPDCNCFGRLRSRPGGWPEISRDVLLAGIATTIVVAGPGETIHGAFRGANPWLLVAALAVGLQGWVSYQLFRQNARLMERIGRLEKTVGELRPPAVQGLAVGQPAPSFSLADLRGGERSLADLLALGLPLALVFADPDCWECASLLPRLARLRVDRAGELTVAVVTRGAGADVLVQLDAYAFESVLLQQHHEVADVYRVQRVPSAVVIAPGGAIASPVAVGETSVEELLAAHSTPPAPVMVG